MYDDKEYHKRYYQEHKEEIKARSNARYKEHREEMKAYNKEWRKKHPLYYKQYKMGDLLNDKGRKNNRIDN